MIILGVDPGIAIVGWGVIEYDGGKMRALDYGAITTAADMKTEDRIAAVYEGLCAIIERHRPDAMAIEELFFNTNQKTGIIVAEARGVLLLAARLHNVPIYEYTPLQIKQSVVGYGRAEKHQVISMVTVFLHLEKPPKPDDTADALACAITHGNTGSSRLADFYNHPTTMAGKIDAGGKLSPREYLEMQLEIQKKAKKQTYTVKKK
ncbi:MAG: crossover junction endodeoxyribonuclease RuvC [Ruminococcaceae bacterium]|nr:crossover junction endodeoxyribonuclease RuvC [Oscillospiraceae bacterium]